MNQYNENTPCPKCGSGFTMTKYDRDADQIGRKCERCGYTWREKPLDAAMSAARVQGENSQ